MTDTEAVPIVDSAENPRTRVLRRWSLILLLIGVVAWSAFAFGFAPHAIRNAYDGHGLGFVAARMRDKANYPVGHYLAKWYGLAGGVLALWIAAIALPLLTTGRNFAERYVSKATPGTLGAIRCFVGCICLYFTWYSKLLAVPVLLADGQLFHSMGVMDLLYRAGLAKIVATDGGAFAWQTATMIAVLFATIGLFTRVSVPVAAALYVATIGVNRSLFWFNHTGLVPFYLLAAMSFMRCGDGFSVDRMIRIWRQREVPDADEPTRYYAWCRWLLWGAVSLGYFLAGLSKLFNSGFLWWEATNMQALVWRHGLNAARSDVQWILTTPLLPHWTWGVMGIMTLVTELGLVAVLFSRWARLIMPILVAGMHYGIIVVMLIPFWDLILIQAVFYDWRAIRKWIAARIARAKPQWTLLYDGYCPLCRRTVGLLHGIDLFDRVRYESFRTADFDAFNRVHAVAITRERADREMLLVRNGTVFGGFDAYQRMSLMMPLLWPIAPLMWLPGFSHVGRAIYAWVARNRLSFFQCTDACQFTPGILPTAPPEPAGKRYPGLALVAGIAPALVVALFVVRVEWYPLTCFQMFTLGDERYTDRSVIAMQKLFLVRPNGEVERAYPDRIGYASKQYWPRITAAFKFERDRKETEAWLRDLGRTWNAKQPSDATRIARFEMREAEWDFRTPSVKPDDAPVRRTIVVNVPPG